MLQAIFILLVAAIKIVQVPLHIFNPLRNTALTCNPISSSPLHYTVWLLWSFPLGWTLMSRTGPPIGSWATPPYTISVLQRHIITSSALYLPCVYCDSLANHACDGAVEWRYTISYNISWCNLATCYITHDLPTSRLVTECAESAPSLSPTFIISLHFTSLHFTSFSFSFSLSVSVFWKIPFHFISFLSISSSHCTVEFSNEAGEVVTRKAQGLLVEKCRFLESAGCARTCLHACKIPTQRFFLEEMGLPVTMLPNMTDFRYDSL